MKEKKIPLRQCLGCQEKKNKADLVRIVSNEEGISVDLTGKKNGRGAYVCKDIKCIEILAKKHGLDRAFKMHVPSETYTQIKEELENLNG